VSDSTAQLEQSILGAVLIKPDTLALLPTLESQDFQTSIGRSTWDAIRNLEAANSPIDFTTIADELARLNRHSDEAMAFLGICATTVPIVANAIEYAKRLKDISLRKRALEGLANLVAEAQRDPDMRGAEVLTACMRLMAGFDAEQPEDANTIGQIVQRRLRELERLEEERRNGGSALTGFPTGIAKLDGKIGGWQPGIVSIIAARPAMGKSSLGLATADACSAAGSGVHLFSLEDAEQPYADRAMSRTSNVPAEQIRRLSLNQGQFASLQDAVRKLSRRKGWLFDGRSGITAEEIVRSVRRKRKENGTKVVIVDYIQLVRKPAPRMSAHEALTENITTLADAAKHDGLAYVVMSQLNRDIEKRDDKRPQPADLRESGSLEERSKCIVGIYRGHAYGHAPKRGIDFDCECDDDKGCTHAPSDEEFAKQVQLILMKNSQGETGKITVSWTGPTTRME
jgi:replicative DNA helicase